MLNKANFVYLKNEWLQRKQSFHKKSTKKIILVAYKNLFSNLFRRPLCPALCGLFTFISISCFYFLNAQTFKRNEIHNRCWNKFPRSNL